jgi:hypothetical protein
MRFTKEYFEKHKPVTNEMKLDELIDMNGSAIEGDLNPSYKDIQTGPVAKSFNDNSDYVKGLATTTDKMSKYAQPRSWWALYYGYGGTPYSHGNRPISEADVAEALVDKKESKEIVEKSKDLDLEEKLKKIQDLVNKSDLSAKDKEKMLNIIKDSKN